MLKRNTKLSKSILRIVMILSIASPSLIMVPSSMAANEITTVVKSSDGFYNVNWIFTFKHPNEVQCDWGSSNAERPVECKFTLKYSINWERNDSTGLTNTTNSQYWTPMLPLSNYLSPSRNRLILLDSKGTEVTSEYSYVSLYGDRSVEKNAEMDFFFTGPDILQFGFKQYILEGYDKPLSITGSGIQVKGLKQSQAQAAYAAAAAKAAADQKVAQDKADAEAKVAADQKAAQDKAAAARKLLTVKCQKGKQTKLVTGENPKCPKGFTNVIGTLLTFKAFQACKLFKKDNPLVNAALQDDGRTLTFSSVGKYKYSEAFDFATYIDLACSLTVMKAPSFVIAQINTTRALDGMQKASWDKLNAFWTYHPDSGINISINQSK